MTDPNEERFQRIERKLNLLVTIAITQSVVLVLLIIGMLLSRMLSSAMPMLLFFLILTGFIVLFRKQLPGWFGSASRFLFAKMLGAQKDHSMKDIS